MTKDEALKHLKAVTEAFGPDEGVEFDQKAWSALHTAIKEALAQPEQEPVAWIEGNEPILTWVKTEPEATPLYTNPPQRTWVGLTDEDDIDWEEGGNLKDLVKAIEAKLKEKNHV